MWVVFLFWSSDYIFSNFEIFELFEVRRVRKCVFLVKLVMKIFFVEIVQQKSRRDEILQAGA